MHWQDAEISRFAENFDLPLDILILRDMPFSAFRLRGSQRLSDSIVDSLGELERQVLAEISRQGSANVASVCDGLERSYAYTTVMTTLDRLYKKELLIRMKQGRAFVYTAKYTAEELERGMTRDIMSTLFDASAGGASPVLACIVDSVSERDRQLLDELELLVQNKRRELEEAK